MERKIIKKVQGFRTKDGAGVSLVRVLGRDTVEDFDPILMLDSFDSTNPDDYTKGFPMHPHRGIETISYLYKGSMVHRDTLWNENAITSGEAGHKGEHLPFNYYDIHLDKGKTFELDVKNDESIMLFTLLGEIEVAGEKVVEKTSVKLSEGTSLKITSLKEGTQILYMSSKKLGEPISWAGPIVMNTPREIQQAYIDLRNNTFIKERIDY